jgi:adenylate cyclase
MGTDSGESQGSRIVAAVRGFNRNPQLIALVRRTRERTLGEELFSDPLSTARGRPADLAVRRFVALGGDERGVVGEFGLTALQTWQRLAEAQDRGRGKADVVILFTDLVGFSDWALEAGDDAALTLLREVSAVIEPPVLEQGGEVVKRLGDGLMAAFRDAPHAFEAALAAHERIRSIEVGGFRPVLRTGIHLGRPRKVGGDYFGVDVNIAARLAEAAKPGEILVSDPVLQRLNPTATRAKRRRFKAKGAPDGLSAYAVGRAG